MSLSQYAQETAMTTIKQMGSHATLNAMLGIKKTMGSAYLIDEKENKDIRIQFDFKVNNKPNVKRVVITYLNSSDTYNMELWKRLSDNQMIKTIDWSVEQLAEKYRVSFFENIHFDQLRELFTDTTGLSLTRPFQ